jgi:hypothetical protein
MKWESLGKSWQTAAEDEQLKVVEPLRTEQDRTRSDSEKVGHLNSFLISFCW